MTPKPLPLGGNVTAAFLNDLVGVYDRVTSTFDVVSLATEQNIYSKVISAGHMSTDRMIRLTLAGDYMNNVGTVGLTFRFKFGGLTLYQDTYTFPSVATTTRKGARISLELMNKGVANNQYGIANINMEPGNVTTAPTAGLTPMNSAHIGPTLSWNGASALDTGVDQTLQVSVQWASASANLSFRRQWALLELL